jgi:hypothetical protein
MAIVQIFRQLRPWRLIMLVVMPADDGLFNQHVLSFLRQPAPAFPHGVAERVGETRSVHVEHGCFGNRPIGIHYRSLQSDNNRQQARLKRATLLKCNGAE